LIFDNSDGRIVGEYASYNEIGIKRKVTRDGQSNYYLNGNKCRRRDITDIFLGTGLGPRSYAIIEQGMISRLIEARPEELRVYIEEAAGISKYKERRRDTENRIRRTMENLERLTDIRDELGRQLNRLERQAKAAEKYSEYKKEERQFTTELLALKWRGYDASATLQKHSIGELEIERERIVTERIGCDTSIEKLRTQSTDLNDTFNEVQARFYKVGGDVARIEQAIEHAQQRASELHKDLEQTERNFTESEQHLNADIQKASGWQAEFDQLAPALELALEAEIVSTETLQAAEESMQQWQQAWDEFNQTSAAPRQQAEVQQSRIQHLEQLMRRLSERHENLATEASSYLASPAEEEMALIQEQLSDAEQARESIENQRVENSAQIETTRSSVKQLSVELDQARSQQQSLNGRRASLEALQQAAMGDDAEKKWLDSKGLGSNPRLVDSVKPSDGWEVAAETVLGSYLQAVAVDDVVANIDLLDDFKKGELLLIGKTGQPAASGNKGKLLSELVSGDAVQGLLGNIYAAETLAEALALQPSLSPIESVVTREGIWLGSNWLRVARDKDATAGVLKRKQELVSIGEQKQTLDKQIGELETQRQSSENQLQELEAQRQEIAGSVAQQQSTYADLRSKLSGFQVQIEQLKARKERADKELEEVHQQQLLEQENLAEARQLLQQSIEKMETDTERRETLVEQREGFREHLDTARQKARQDRDERHDLAVREGSLSTQLSSILEGIERLKVQVARLQERRTQLREAFDIKDDPSDKYQLELEEKLELRLTIEGELNTARAAMEEVDHEMRKQETQRSEREEQLQEVSGRLETQRIAAQEIRTLSRTIEEQIIEKNGDLETLLENLAEDAEMVDWEEQLQLIGNRINRLGPINLAAIDEYKIESERKDYLDTQNAELEEAMETLRTAIQKIDRETRTRFKETFDLVNTNIQELFPKLFGGGHAYLELTGDDLLDTGVTLMARPPGKKNASIQLLSGGEKALTAIAMVFAIFRLNPAPFCMLDEVDAPLDDANVGRYAAMVKEMSDQVQFIFITHNKISMEAANQLMGVTMHEPGVSRLVSVDVNQAAELADA
ncbi:MAG: chromosome segregation protein SMC, partial [Porticoccaceae bacterium]|nr:chromosome segregation protein SMC [Porticoccaceae bacterium]